MRVFAIIKNMDNARRPIDIPDNEEERSEMQWAYMMPEGDETQLLLNLAFRYGQNDFQPREFYSVSVGDVIDLGELGLHRVDPFGFSRVTS